MTKDDRFKMLCDFGGYGNISAQAKLVFVLMEEAGADELLSEAKADEYV